MLKITPYLGMIVLIVSLGGIFYPRLGYFLLLVFATLMIIAPFRGRWFCGNLCPRGSFVDFWLSPLSRKLEIPYRLKVEKERCIDCGKCQKVCPMQLMHIARSDVL